MLTTVKGRLMAYIESKKISVRSFERDAGLSYGYVSNMRKSIQPDKITSIAEHFPDINTGWLLTGEGEMLKTAAPQPEAADTIQMPREVFDQINELIHTVKSQQDSIRSLSNVAESLARIEEKIDKRGAMPDTRSVL